MVILQSSGRVKPPPSVQMREVSRLASGDSSTMPDYVAEFGRRKEPEDGRHGGLVEIF
jgi:hypothetical protein